MSDTALTPENRKLMDSASDAAIREHVVNWINLIRKTHLSCGPINLDTGYRGEEGSCPIARSFLAFTPLQDITVHENMTFLQRTTRQVIQVDHPFFVEYFIQEFDKGERFQQLDRGEMVETPA